ncbi:MAG: hypothetical protein ABUL68_04520 [Pseudomonadota bacterium]
MPPPRWNFALALARSWPMRRAEAQPGSLVAVNLASHFGNS